MRRSFRSMLLGGLAVGSLVMTAACGSSTATSEESPDVNSAGDEADGTEGLVIDGEEIADAALLAAAREEGKMTLYTSAAEGSERKLAEAFTEDTGIEVDVLVLGAPRLSERIQSEGAVGRLGADVIRMADQDYWFALDEEGLIQQYEVPFMDKMIPEAIHDDGLYYSSWRRANTFGYNTQLIDEASAPETWEDLLAPEYEGKLGIVSVTSGGSSVALTRFHFDKLGEDYLRQYADQDPMIFDSNSPAIDAVARGQLSASAMTVGNVSAAIRDGAPIELVFPPEGIAVFPHFIGLPSDPENEAAGKLFLNWTFSLRGQNLIAAQADYSVRTDEVDPPSIGDLKLPGANEVDLVLYSYDEIAEHKDEDRRIWTELFNY